MIINMSLYTMDIRSSKNIGILMHKVDAAMPAYDDDRRIEQLLCEEHRAIFVESQR